MKFSEAWLREWVDPPLSSQAIGDCLTMAGLELDSMYPAAPAFSGVVVARIVEVAAHPEADHLKICQVDDGQGQALQVVCGASNVVPEMRAPFARIGARMPDGAEIKPTTLRGAESFGMLCSARELGLAETSAGLLALPTDAPLGQSVRDYLRLDDMVMDIDLTPNRADCLSVAGIARELAALTEVEISVPAVTPTAPAVDDRLPVVVEASEDCPRYVGRVIRSITPGAPAPLWMQERLRRGGIRNINPIVDVTNYVMLELGQPMHAFDMGKLCGGVRVRRAEENESLALLDGRDITLAAGTLVIADHERVVALAGIMGGQDTAVDGATRDVFLESAFFAPRAIAGRARAYALSTDSSHRFERGVDPELQARAIERATQLLSQIVGGKPGPVVDVTCAEYLPARPTIALRAARVARLLGVHVGPDRIASILRSLGCRVETEGSDLSVIPPGFRFDLSIEADLVEEVGRVYGYGRIPATTRNFAPVIRPRPEAQVTRGRLRSGLVDRGYQEAITYSFVDADTNLAFSPGQVPKTLSNPISAELAVMRGSLWPGLLKAAQYNLNRQQTRVRLFELGLQFSDYGDGLRQTSMLAGLALGDVLPEQWGVSPRGVDFYDVKGDVEALLDLVGAPAQTEFQSDSYPPLHPGQSARIVHAGRGIGRLGALHPALAGRLDFKRQAYLFELDLAVLEGASVARFREISKFPAIRRDIAIVVDAAVTAAQVRQCLVSAGDPRLQDVHIFDVYTGEGVADGAKSLALGLILQDLTRTLHDEEVDAAVSRMVTALTHRLGAALRG